MEGFLALIPLLPFLGFLANGLLGRRLSPAAVSWVGCLAPGLSFALGLGAFLELALGAEERVLGTTLWEWIAVPGKGESALSAPLGFALDRLSGVMVLVVTGVGTLIHIYSVGYMHGDRGYARFFAFLNLFTASMLVLVLADNIVLLFLGWEGVGLCSYLLIGFWYEDLSNCAAAVKAFVVNRIGDLGFLLGIFLIFVTFGTFRFSEINAAAAGQDPRVVAWIALLLFVGATGKSAQIPLYVWLPDAMAGPTPVSALIHAATMVTSGVYMVARLGPLYAAAPEISFLVAAAGMVTALLAALIAVSQWDIKKVLAYSTVSQLGYMFLAAGAGAHAVAIFHLVTHAFFKALLFLGAGAVIHSLHHEQDMSRMGGLRRRIPQTFWVFVIGALALSGFPLTAGFFSKDEILHAAHARAGGGWTALWIAGLVTAALTGFYAFRQVALVFFGEHRGRGAAGSAAAGGASPADSGGGGAGSLEEVRESPLVMRAPLFVLAALSLAGGLLAVPLFLEGHVAGGPLPAEGQVTGWILGGSLALAGIGAALALFVRAPALIERLLERSALARGLARLSRGKFYVDELYDRLLVRPLFVLAEILFILVDRALIDGLAVGGTGAFTRALGGVLRRVQTGRVPAYAGWFLLGALGVLASVLWFG